MAVSGTFRSELVYKASTTVDIEPIKPKLAEVVRARVDSIIEYPGSRKGEFGEWRLMDWVGAKVEQFSSKGGRERG